TGQPPFQEGTVAQKLIWHQTRQPKAVRAIRAEVPEGIAAIIDRMMTKDRAKRYQTPAQVVDALAQWTSKPIQQPPDAWMPRLSPAAMGGMESVSVAGATPSPGGLPPAAARAPSATPAPAPARPSGPVMVPPRPPPAPPPARPPVAAQPRPSGPQPAALQRPAVQPGNGAAANEPAPNWGDLAPSGANAALRRPAPGGKSSGNVPAVASSKFARTMTWIATWA